MPTEDPPAITPALEGIFVLIVEDTDDARTLLATLCTLHGAQVTAASSQAQALELLKQVNPNVLLVDMTLPDGDGFSLLGAVRAQGRTVPALAVTAYGEVEDRPRVLAAGFQEYLLKPVDTEHLLAAIRRCMDRNTS
jgi:DNA-binding response OmpR family regulator